VGRNPELRQLESRDDADLPVRLAHVRSEEFAERGSAIPAAGNGHRWPETLMAVCGQGPSATMPLFRRREIAARSAIDPDARRASKPALVRVRDGILWTQLP